MDDSMNSVHNISAMDISPASSPKIALNPIPSNHLLLNAFQQQQELLSNMLFNAPNKHDYLSINKNPISDEYDNQSDSVCLYTTVLTDNNAPTIPNESNHLRQRIVIEPVSSVVEPTIAMKKSQSNASRQSFNKLLLVIPLLIILISYLITQRMNTSHVLRRSSTWQNASVYLRQHLIGQDQGLDELQESMDKHKNFSVVIIEGPTGTGKSYLASSLEKFLPTTLLSANTLLGLSTHHWTESDRLSLYLSSCLSPSLFQFFIIDDLDLLSTNETYCQTLTTALELINDKRNLFILLLHTGTMANLCRENLNQIITKSIRFNMLQRQHIRTCIENEAYAQNVQPPFDNQQIEHMLNSMKYLNEQGVLYSTMGCKQIPSLVILASKKKNVY